jgi:hypothetical protein
MAKTKTMPKKLAVPTETPVEVLPDFVFTAPQMPQSAGDWLTNQDRGKGDDGQYLGYKVVVGPPVATRTKTVGDLVAMGIIGLYFLKST